MRPPHPQAVKADFEFRCFVSAFCLSEFDRSWQICSAVAVTTAHREISVQFGTTIKIEQFLKIEPDVPTASTGVHCCHGKLVYCQRKNLRTSPAFSELSLRVLSLSVPFPCSQESVICVVLN